MLTRKQYELLMFIQERSIEAAIPPSFDAMKDALDLKSKPGIHRLITAFQERRIIRRPPNRARNKSKAWASLLVFSLIAFCSSLQAQIIFQDSFEFRPFDWKFVTAWQEERPDTSEVQIVVRGTSPDFAAQDANTNPNGVQAYPAIAMDAQGRFVVVWQDDADGNGLNQIHARGFNADGSERFPVFTVNSTGAGQQQFPDIAMAPNGDFVVVWEDDQNNNHFYDIWGRGFNANGTQKWSDRRINSNLSANQYDPAVGIAPDGSFVVTWSDDGDNNGYYQIRARAYTPTGAERLNEFVVNTEGDGQQLESDVAVAPDGAFVIVWSDDQDSNLLYQIFGRGFNVNGSERFSDRRINSFSPGNQYAPAVGMTDEGSFFAVWVDGGVRIAARGFNSDGSPKYDDLQSNAEALLYHGKPDIAVAPGGQFLVVWEQLTENGNWSMRGRQIQDNGSTTGAFTSTAEAGATRLAPVVASRPSS